ncbi:MAG: response regulator [Terriglobales bacterium]
MGPFVRAILLVEDDANDARLLKRAFDKIGLEVPVVRVEHGDDAVAYLRGENQYVDRALYPMPSIVLLDLKLPRRSGFEVLQWVRGTESECRRLPIVVLSSSDEPSDINRSYEMGANSYLAKPHSTQEFVALAEAFRDYWIDLNRDPQINQLYC